MDGDITMYGPGIGRLPVDSAHNHAVETSRGTFVVCRGSFYDRNDDAVYEFDPAGHTVIRVYADSRRRQFVDPCYLALTSDDRVLVADYSRRAVLLLNSRLELERVVIDKEPHLLRYDHPTHMCYVEQTRQLVLVLGDSKLLKVFHVDDL